ncbi:MAG: hypothetical protein HYY25_12165 [Candidatus Wallbacteria bacterium]|nr:hypothetical protein [Candidatus Wallbacteria bacterium]
MTQNRTDEERVEQTAAASAAAATGELGELSAARAAGTFLNHSLNNSLQAVMYRAELLREHEDPQVAEAGRFLAECVRAMADTVRLVGSLRRFATVPYPGSEKMLDPSCLEGEEQWSI